VLGSETVKVLSHSKKNWFSSIDEHGGIPPGLWVDSESKRRQLPAIRDHPGNAGSEQQPRPARVADQFIYNHIGHFAAAGRGVAQAIFPAASPDASQI